MITDPIVRITKEIQTLQHFVDFGWYLDTPSDKLLAKVAIQNLKELVFMLHSVPQ
jgi:protoheme ferro-lyase